MKLAVIFPGIGYHTDKPLLYYSKKLSDHDDILFISKSIGTTVAAGYARKYDLKVRHIFFTPLDETFR